MKVHCRLELRYGSSAEAAKVLRAVAVDNEGYVQARREGTAIVSEASADSILSLLHTLEDYLACVSVAEKTLKEARGNPREREPPRRARRRASRRGS